MLLFKKKIKRGNSIFYSWLLSYVSIMMIPVIACVITYVILVKNIEGEIDKTNSALLKLVQQDIDDKIREVEKLSYQIAFNEKINRALNFRIPLNASDRYTILEIIKEFDHYITFKGIVYNCFIFMKDTDLAITLNTMYDVETLYKSFFTKSGLTFEQWYDLIKGPHKNDYFPITITDAAKAENNTIAFAVSVPVSYPGKSTGSGTVISLIDEDELRKIANSVKWVNQSVVLIINSKNEVITSSQPGKSPEALFYDNLTQPGKPVYDEFYGEKAVVFYLQSQVNDWKYVSIIPVRIYMERARYVRNITAMFIFLCIMAGGFVAYLFTKRNYTPVNELVNEIASNVEIPVNRDYNEYRFIREAIKNAMTEKNEIHEIIKRQNIALRSNFLARLLKGRQDDMDSICEALNSFNIVFHSDSFAVMLFYIDSFDSSYYGEDYGQNLKLVQFIINNVVEELVCRKHYGIMTEVDEMQACLINFKSVDSTDETREMMEIANEARQFMSDKCHINISVSFSAVNHSISGIYEAYRQALEAMEYRMVLGSGKVICYNDIQRPKAKYVYSIEMEQKLINFIKTGDFGKAGKLLDDVFESNFSRKILSIQNIKCMLFDIIGTLIKVMDETGFDSGDAFGRETNPINHFISCGSIIEIKNRMMRIMKDLCEHAIKHKKSHNQQLVEELKDFIDKNYYDMNLSVTLIAEKFNMHPVYLSSFCKEHIGKSLLDYLNDVRINKVKQFLKDGSLSVKDAAVRAGYYNSNAFIRAFKKIEGITPGKYKEIWECRR